RRRAGSRRVRRPRSCRCSAEPRAAGPARGPAARAGGRPRRRGGTIPPRRPVRCAALDRTDLAFARLARQAELVRAGEVRPGELVELYLERIARIDPQLNAVRIVFAERALAEADQAAGRVGAGDERPLLGVPVLIKDDVDVAGAVTCKGS